MAARGTQASGLKKRYGGRPDLRTVKNVCPNATLKALADHGELGTIRAADGGDSETVLAQFAKAGVEQDALAAHWNELMGMIASKSDALKKAVWV